MNLPFVTRDLPGVGGTIKNRNEDFAVTEVPLYEPSGEGEHVFCEIQKTGLTTFDAVDRIARELDISPRVIGYAGMKDARAVTRQHLSIWGATEEAVLGLKIPNLVILWAKRHINKLRLGHLVGNRFIVKIRDVSATDVVRAKSIVTVLEQRGMPNYFGEQRFGRRGDNDKLGAAVVRGDARDLLGHLLGHPNEDVDDRKTAHARAAFDRGELDLAMRLYPRSHGMERRILARLIKTKKPGAAARAVDDKLRRLWVSALQSRLFNDVVARRIDSLSTLFDGDLAWKHDSGAVFPVESAAAEQPRCDAFEISPSGPLIGYRLSQPTGKPMEIENGVFGESKLTPGDFRRAGELKVKGARRPLRVRPTELEFAGGVDEHGPHITLAFTLPAGSFATMLIREITKAEDEADAADGRDDESSGIEPNDGADSQDN